MIFSRFWYLALSAALAGAVFLLFLATSVSNSQEEKSAARLLTAASHSASFYMKDDARTRDAALLTIALHPDVTAGLKQSSVSKTHGEIPKEARTKARAALRKFRESTQSTTEFNALFAVDVQGRVLASDNFGDVETAENAEAYELGGYSVVADALHGWVRDDVWLLGDDLWKVVARPVEVEVGAAPVGAIVGGRKIDEPYAQAIAEQIGAAIVFYANGKRIARGAPPSMSRALLDLTVKDIEPLADDPDYAEVGRTKARLLRGDAGYDLRAVFAKLSGEAREAGAGYAVVYQHSVVRDPLEFRTLATETDRKTAPTLFIGLGAVAATLLGLIFSLLEHTRPLNRFRRAVEELADKASRTDVLKPSMFGGTFRVISAKINDALDKAALGSGHERGPADLKSVLGPMGGDEKLSAFSAPRELASSTDPFAKTKPSPKARALPTATTLPSPIGGAPRSPVPKPAEPAERASLQEDAETVARPFAAAKLADAAPHSMAASEEDDATALRHATAKSAADAAALDAALSAGSAPADNAPSSRTLRRLRSSRQAMPVADGSDPFAPAVVLDEETEWRNVYTEFVALKRELGEPVDKLTYDKFKGTLQRNKEALVARHACERVSFKVYEKDGRAALKASPLK